MFRFNLIKRLPTKPLLGLAGLALALVAAGGGAARPANAQTGTWDPTFLVTFDRIAFSKLNDCNFGWDMNCARADLYGRVTAVSNGGSSGGRLLAAHAAWKESNWDDPTCGLICRKLVWQTQGDLTSNAQLFYQTPLCTLSTAFVSDASAPPESCKVNNNSMVIAADVGEAITVGASLYDYDKASANDAVCVTSKPIVVTQAMMVRGATAKYIMSRAFNGYGSCVVTVTITKL